MSVEFANMTYESQSGAVAGKVQTTAKGADIFIRSQEDARLDWELHSSHESESDARKLLGELLEYC